MEHPIPIGFLLYSKIKMLHNTYLMTIFIYFPVEFPFRNVFLNSDGKYYSSRISAQGYPKDIHTTAVTSRAYSQVGCTL